MPTTLQFRRFGTTGLSAVTGANGEIIVDTDKDTVTVHDGVTVGGTPLAKEASVVAKSGDTMTGQLNISSGGLLVTGNVGIGVANATSKLHVVGTANITSNVIVNNGTLFVDAVGNEVGIGTTAPTSNLHVTGTANVTANLTLGAGAVGSPSLTTAGDDNTGIFFPAADTIAFAEGGSEAMRIDSAGNVGIGNTAPASKLTVAGTIESTSGGIKFPDGSTQTSAATGATITDDTSTNATRYVLLSTGTSGSLSAANVASSKLYFNPSTGDLAATSFSSLSDAVAKTDINSIENSLDILDQINAVEFKWKENGTKSYGVLAQEIEKILPELVNTNNDGQKTVAYTPLIAFLISAVKELAKEVKNKG